MDWFCMVSVVRSLSWCLSHAGVVKLGAVTARLSSRHTYDESEEAAFTSSSYVSTRKGCVSSCHLGARRDLSWSEWANPGPARAIRLHVYSRHSRTAACVPVYRAYTTYTPHALRVHSTFFSRGARRRQARSGPSSPPFRPPRPPPPALLPPLAREPAAAAMPWTPTRAAAAAAPREAAELCTKLPIRASHAPAPALVSRTARVASIRLILPPPAAAAVSAVCRCVPRATSPGMLPGRGAG